MAGHSGSIANVTLRRCAAICNARATPMLSMLRAQ
jgi:hypothetical protein